jgi:hypothetical protein
MSRLRTIAAIPAGSWTKWVVVGWPSTLARTPDPAPAELGQERAALVAGRTS